MPVLGLAGCHRIKKVVGIIHRIGQLVQQFELKLCRYREVISLPFPPMAIASLRAVCQRCCTPLLNKSTDEVLHLYRCSTHTHTRRVSPQEGSNIKKREDNRESKRSGMYYNRTRRRPCQIAHPLFTQRYAHGAIALH